MHIIYIHTKMYTCRAIPAVVCGPWMSLLGLYMYTYIHIHINIHLNTYHIYIHTSINVYTPRNPCRRVWALNVSLGPV